MITLPQVKMLAKENNISFTGLNKDEIIALLIDKNIITTSDIFKQKIVVKNKMCQNNSEQNNKYSYLKGIRTNPKKVEVFDLQTNETTTYTSKYKTGRALGINPMYFDDGKLLKNRYRIKVS